MTLTAPILPHDEVPISKAELEKLLSTMEPEMVLVGGQAIGFWLDRYDLHTQGMTVSQDGDVLGTLLQARHIAAAVGGVLITPEKTRLTSLTAQVRFPRAQGKYSNIDFLHLLFTTRQLSNSVAFTERVKKGSIEVHLPTGTTFHVMNQMDLLESRLYNAVGLLDEKGLHVVTQLKWAVQIMHCAFQEALQHQAEAAIYTPDDASQPAARIGRRVGALVKQVFELAKGGAGKRALKEYGIEILDAIPLDAIEAQNPDSKRQTKVVREALSQRKALAPGSEP